MAHALLWLGLVALLGAEVAPAATLAKPNIVYIMLDDAGIGDISAYGDGSFVQTPEIDQLAADGALFTQHYSNAPVCSPTRAAILTGRYAQDFGFRRVVPPDSARGLPSQVLTLPKLVGPEGYASGFFGKWHVGEIQAQHLPNAMGFDESAIYRRDETAISYLDPEFLVDDTTTVPRTGHLTELITDYALDFIDDHVLDSFLVCVWYVAPHFPYEPPSGWEQKWPYANDSHGQYAALISNADEQIGRIVDRLDTLGLTGTSIVLVTSDNGSPREEMESNASFRGGKTDVFEGGIRSPMIVRWPSVVAPGSTVDALSMSFDFLPSIASALSVDITGQGIDGIDLSAVIQGGTAAPRPAPLFWETKDASIRTIPLNGDFNRWAVRDGTWKLVQQDNNLNFNPFLFDLANDPREEIDLYSRYPEIAAGLNIQYRQWRLDSGAIPFSVDSLVGNVVQNGNTFTFIDGTVVVTDDARYNTAAADFSFEVRVTPADLNKAGVQYIAQKFDSWRLIIREDDTLRFIAQDVNKTANTQITSSVVLQEDVEYAITVTIYGWRYDNSLVRLYIDGALQGESQSISQVHSNASPVLLGRSSSQALGLVGDIADPQFYALSLTQHELRDTDGDGFRNAVDNCADDSNVTQDDFDNDSIGDPCDLDDDDDGLVDTVETDTGIFNSLVDTGTDPMNADSDGDGSPDGVEALAGYDPTDWNSRAPAFTQRIHFESRLLGRVGLTDFDSFPPDHILSGTTIQVAGGADVALPVVTDVLGGPGDNLDLMVIQDQGANPALSSDQTLGTDDPSNYDTISAGTEVTFSFPSPAQGFGLSVVTPDQRFSSLLDQDVRLEVPGIGTTLLSLDHGQYIETVDGLDYYAYFLGVVGEGNDTFATATLRYDGIVTPGNFLFNIDDMISVPEPEFAALLIAAAIGLIGAHRVGPLRTRGRD